MQRREIIPGGLQVNPLFHFQGEYEEYHPQIHLKRLLNIKVIATKLMNKTYNYMRKEKSLKKRVDI